MVLPSKVYKYQSFGGRDIKFTLQEAAKLGVVGQRGIKLIGFMKQSKLDVSHHLEAPKFVTYDESELEGMPFFYGWGYLYISSRNICSTIEIL